MQAICCRLFQSASSSSASIFCTYSMADSRPASSLTIPCQKGKQTFSSPLTSSKTCRFHPQEKRSCPRLHFQGCSRHQGRPHAPIKAFLCPGGSRGPGAGRTLRIWSSAVSICSSCCIFCRVTDWLLPFRSCMSAQRGGKASAEHAPPALRNVTQRKRLHGGQRRSRHSARCRCFSSRLLLPALPPGTWLAFLHSQQRQHLQEPFSPGGQSSASAPPEAMSGLRNKTQALSN